MRWFLKNRADLARHITYLEPSGQVEGRRLLAVPSRNRLERLLRYLLDEQEFLSPYGIRSLSRFHRDHPCTFYVDGQEHRVEYAPGESTTGDVRRQLELARTDLVSAQFPVDRGARTLPPLLRRLAQGRVSDRIGKLGDAGCRGTGDRRTSHAPVPAGRGRRAALPWQRSALRGGSALSRSGAVLRVLPRRRRPRARREPPDRLDRAGRSMPGGGGENSAGERATFPSPSGTKSET